MLLQYKILCAETSKGGELFINNTKSSSSITFQNSFLSSKIQLFKLQLIIYLWPIQKDQYEGLVQTCKKGCDYLF